jgi:recombination protein RecA
MSSTKTESSAKEKASAQTAERKTLDLALSAINKQYGDGTLMRMGDATKMQISTV